MTFGKVKFMLKLLFISMINQIIYLLLSHAIILWQTEAIMPPKRYYLFIKLRSVKYDNARILTPLLGTEFLQTYLLLKRRK